jgi:hypothetical protein
VGSHFGLAISILGLAKSAVVKEKAADFVAFDCTSQEKSGPRSRGLRGVRGVKNSVKGVKNGSHCPGNERCCVVVLLNVMSSAT